VTRKADWYQEGWEKCPGQGTGSLKERPNAAGSVPGRYAGLPSDGKITLDKLFGHLKTVTMHRMLVAQGCFQVGLYWQGLTHDLSKFSPVEFWNSVRYYQYGKQSPNNGERVAKGFSESWIHHKGHNMHHYEHWTDYNVDAAKRGEFPIRPVQMPRRYVAEMLMDRIAASKTYMKEHYTQHEPLKYYIRGKAGDLMHPQTAKELEGMLRILDVRGEAACFRYVKNYYLKGYPVVRRVTLSPEAAPMRRSSPT
jgi:hypothetical protein